MAGLHDFLKGEIAYASEKKAIGPGKVGIEWLGHGSFLFTSCKGKRILLDPWTSTNPKCPGKYRKKGSFGSVDLVLFTHGHVDHFMLPDAKEIVGDYQPKIVAPWELSFFIKKEIPGANCQTFVLGNKGATADFDGVEKCDVFEYELAIAHFLNGLGAAVAYPENVVESVIFIDVDESGKFGSDMGDTVIITFKGNITKVGDITADFDVNHPIISHGAKTNCDITDNVLTFTINAIFDSPRPISGEYLISIDGLEDSVGNLVVVPNGGVEVQ